MSIEPPDQYEIEMAMHKAVSDYGVISELARAMSKSRSVVSRQFNPDGELDNPVAAFCLLLYGCKRKKPEAMRLAWSIAESYYAYLNGREVGEQTADELIRAIRQMSTEIALKARQLPPADWQVLMSQVWGAVNAGIAEAGKAQLERPAEVGE